MFSLIIFLITILIVVGVHEYGHYIAARSCGVRVLRFAIGFGKPIISHFDKNGTEWCLCPIPLGGYVQMVNDEKMALELKVPPEESLEGIPRLQRSWVVFAGPLANFLLAIILFFFIALAGETGLKATIGRVIDGSIAQQEGFLAGDSIIAIDDHPSTLWSSVHQDIFTAISDHDLKVLVEDENQFQRTLKLPTGSMEPAMLDNEDIFTTLGLVPDRSFVSLELETIIENSPAAIAGLQSGDYIIAANNQVLYYWDEFVEIIRANANSEVELIYERNGQEYATIVIPELATNNNISYGRLGVVPLIDEAKQAKLIHTQKADIATAFVAAFRRTWEAIKTTARFFGYLITAQVSTDHLSGPIGIAQIASSAANLGFNVFLLFIAQISISLGVINLVPIPILDGGHLLRYAIEGVINRPLPVKIIHYSTIVGVAFLVALMIFAVYNDLT